MPLFIIIFRYASVDVTEIACWRNYSCPCRAKCSGAIKNTSFEFGIVLELFGFSFFSWGPLSQVYYAARPCMRARNCRCTEPRWHSRPQTKFSTASTNRRRCNFISHESHDTTISFEHPMSLCLMLYVNIITLCVRMSQKLRNFSIASGNRELRKQ